MGTMKANADKILKLYNERDNLALRGINPHDYGDSIDLAKAKQQLADGLVAAMKELPERGFAVPRVGTDDHSKGTFTKLVSSQEVEELVYAYFGIGRNHG